jgi:hypothetical protein
MAEEILVKEALSTEMVSAGTKLANHLNHSHLVIDALLWLYVPELNVWRFLIASPEVGSQGPKKIYQQIRAIIAKIPEAQQTVPFSDIFVVDSKDPLIMVLRTIVKTGQEISGLRFSKNVIKGVLIEDSYIYKLTSNAARPKRLLARV